MRARFLQLIYERIVLRDRVYCVYATREDQTNSAIDSNIHVFDAVRPPTAEMTRLYQSHMGRFRSWPMFNRLRHHGALLMLHVEQGELLGFGWVQSGRPMQREFWWLDDHVVCLGPFWTHPDYRGRGVYGKLLAASIAECRRRGWDRSYIWAQSSNTPSIRGIEKAGFSPLGTHRVRSYFMGLIRRHHQVNAEPRPA